MYGKKLFSKSGANTVEKQSLERHMSNPVIKGIVQNIHIHINKHSCTLNIYRYLKLLRKFYENSLQSHRYIDFQIHLNQRGNMQYPYTHKYALIYTDYTYILKTVEKILRKFTAVLSLYRLLEIFPSYAESIWEKTCNKTSYNYMFLKLKCVFCFLYF